MDLSRFRERRWVRLLPVAAMLLLLPIFLNSHPTEQTLVFVVGTSGNELTDVNIRYLEPSGTTELHAVRYSFRQGTAPRTLTHTPKLASGDYRVDVTVAVGGRLAHASYPVALKGGTTRVNLPD